VTENRGKSDFWILKIDSQGNLLWQKINGGSDEEYAMTSLEIADGSYITVGVSQSTDGDAILELRGN
jgi:hypothetical protein